MVPSSPAFQRQLAEEIAEGESANHPIRRWLHGIRESVAERPRLNIAYRIFLGFIGFVIILAGVVMLVTPGPGWLTIFLGLAVLSTEFQWAKRLSQRAKQMLSRFWAWWHDRRERRRTARPGHDETPAARSDGRGEQSV